MPGLVSSPRLPPSCPKVATTSTSSPITSPFSVLLPHPPPPSPSPNRPVHWVVQSCQSLAGPAKLQVLVRGEAGANGRVVFVGPADLPPLSSGPPQQIDSPAGRHGAHHGPMLRAHMPRSTNSHLHTNMHAHTNICMYEDTCLPVDRNKHMQTHKHKSAMYSLSLKENIFMVLNTRKFHF